jgi:hypothetical protein
MRYGSGNIQYCNGSAWSTMTSGTSTVTGAGTANYGAVWSGATTLVTDSALYVDTTNHRIGIGTTSPGTNLQVSGSVYSGGPSSGVGFLGLSQGTVANSGYVSFYQSNSTRVGYLGFGYTGGGLFFATDNSTPLYFTPSGTTAMTVTAAGYVGIGTTAPSYPLDVTNSLSVAVAANLGGDPGVISIGGVGSGKPNAFISSQYNAQGGNPLMVIGSNVFYSGVGGGWQQGDSGKSSSKIQLGYGQIYFNTGYSGGGTNMGVMTSTGLGIGVAAPAYKLEVYGNTNVSNTTPYSIMYEGSAATNMHRWDEYASSGVLRYRAVNDAYNAANSYMEVSRTAGSYGISSVSFPNGNVGIGTTDNLSYNGTGNAKTLVVAGSGTSTNVNDNDTGIVIRNTATTTNNTSGLHFAAASGGGSNANPIDASIVAIHGARTSGQYHSGTLAFLTAPGSNVAPVERMRIDPSGYISMGTGPENGTQLTVEGATNQIRLRYPGLTCMYLKQTSSGNVEIANQNAASIYLATNGNAGFFTLASTGYVGMNTSTPGYPLEISASANANHTIEVANTNTGASAAAGVYVRNAGTYGGFLQVNSAANNTYLGPNTVNIGSPHNAGIGYVVNNALMAMMYNTGMIIGTAGQSTAVSFTVVGDIRVGTSGTNGCVQQFAGTALTGTCSSDERLKKDIEPLDGKNVLERLALIKPSSFVWRADEHPELHLGTGKQIGVIAQQVEQSFPELVDNDPSSKWKKVKFGDLPIYLLQGIRELKEMFDTDHADLIGLKAANDNLVSETAALELRLKAANDNYADLKREVESLKRATGRGR